MFWYECTKIHIQFFPQLHTTGTHFYNSSKSIGSSSFFSSSDMHQSHHLSGCHAASNSSLDPFFKFFSFYKFNMLSQKSRNNVSIRIIFIKFNIKTNIIKIYIKNTYSFTTKCGFVRAFIKLVYIFICIKSSKTFFNHFTCIKPIGNMSQYC